MARDREIQCKHYICEGNCDLGKEGTFRKACQTCKTYSALRGAKPARVDTRKAREQRRLKKEKIEF